MRFAELSSAAMTALLDGSLAQASRQAGIALTPYFLTDGALRLWRRRVSQTAADPGSAPWVARAVVAEPEGVVAGHAGFHGPPDETGMVEVAYSVDPAYRRRGFARAMLRAQAQPAPTAAPITARRIDLSCATPRPRVRIAQLRRAGPRGYPADFASQAAWPPGNDPTRERPNSMAMHQRLVSERPHLAATRTIAGW